MVNTLISELIRRGSLWLSGLLMRIALALLPKQMLPQLAQMLWEVLVTTNRLGLTREDWVTLSQEQQDSSITTRGLGRCKPTYSPLKRPKRTTKTRKPS